MKYALCKGRHTFPKDCVGYIFPHHVDPTDLKRLNKEMENRFTKVPYRLDVYVTGLTVALVTVINYCFKHNVWLVLWHYNSDTGSYYPQSVLTERGQEF